ncbi:MAG: hypothetical protein ACR2NU_15670 [Aeoliella sp.]
MLKDSSIRRGRMLGIALSLAFIELVCHAQVCHAQAPLRTSATAAALPEPVHWAQDLFLIPYKWNSASDPNQAQSVKLFISRDQGRSWQEISTAKPEVQFFTYHAPSDGEYWFSIRTIDAAGRAWPDGAHQPELRVVVDTENPQVVAFDAQLTALGQVRSAWQASDAHIDTNHIRMQFRTPVSNEWRDVPTSGLHQPAASSAAGEATWQVPAGTSSVWVRLSVRDRAGNGQEAGAEARIGSATPAQDLPVIAAGAGAPRLRTADTGQPENSSAAGWTSFGSQANGDPPSPERITAQNWPSDGESSVPLGAPRTAVLPQLPSIPTTSPSQSTQAAASPFQFPQNHSVSPPARSASASAGPGTNPPPFPRTQTPDAGLRAAETAPPTDEMQFLNSLDFEIGYDVDTAGTFGVTWVELWATRDEGRSWKRLAVDSDNRSPIRATVPGEGDYGLKIVVATAGGVEPARPRPGDVPEMIVRIDTTSPTAKLTGLEQGEGYFTDHLMVSWQADDSSASDSTVSLSYSSHSTGPWVVAASGLRHNGRYAWRLARHLPAQFYVRLEVRDPAGNVATDLTAVPVTVDLPTPSVRLQSARPIAQQSQ